MDAWGPQPCGNVPKIPWAVRRRRVVWLYPARGVVRRRSPRRCLAVGRVRAVRLCTRGVWRRVASPRRRRGRSGRRRGAGGAEGGRQRDRAASRALRHPLCSPRHGRECHSARPPSRRRDGLGLRSGEGRRRRGDVPSRNTPCASLRPGVRSHVTEAVGPGTVLGEVRRLDRPPHPAPPPHLDDRRKQKPRVLPSPAGRGGGVGGGHTTPSLGPVPDNGQDAVWSSGTDSSLPCDLFYVMIDTGTFVFQKSEVT